MPLSRRNLLSLTALAGLGAWSGAPALIASAAPVLPPSGVTWTDVPDAAHLQAALNGIPAFDGTNLAYLRMAPGTYLVPTIYVRKPGVWLDAAGCTFILNETAGRETALLQIKGQSLVNGVSVSDVVINGGTWDGNKAKAKVSTEYRHAIRVDYAHRVKLQNLIAQNAKGDGVYIGSYATPSKDITLSQVTCRENHRNGMSITSVDGFLAEKCKFINNGSTAPMSGACIEPNHEASIIENLVFNDCNFDNNRDRGVLVKMRIGSSNTPKTGIVFDRCTFYTNGRTGKNGSLTGGLVLLRPRLVTVKNSRLYNNQRGIFIQGKRPGDKVRANGRLNLTNAKIYQNQYEGVRVSNAITQITATGTEITKNSRRSRSSASSIYLQQKTGLRMTTSSASGSKGYGIRTNKQKSSIVLDNATYKGLSGNKKSRLSKSTKVTRIA